jgi:DNA-directed RNA polymerase subunit RPC12/RpoP
MPRQTTHKEFLLEVRDLVGDEYTVLSEYKKYHTPIEFRHEVCKRTFSAKRGDFRGSSKRKGTRCPFCAGFMKVTKESFEEKISHINSYICLSNYTNYNEKVILRHICGNEFEVTPKGFLGGGTRCPKCSHRSYRYSTDEFKSQISTITNNEYEFIDEYTNTHDKKKFIHKECNTIFTMRPNNFIVKGNRCPNCISSKGEEFIRQWLTKHNISFSEQYNPPNTRSKFIKYDFKIDLPEGYFFIEYDGRFHYEAFLNLEKHKVEFIKRQEIDQYKNKFCIDNGIGLVRIPYWEFDNLGRLLEIMFNDYLHSESTESSDSGNIDIEKYFISQ